MCRSCWDTSDIFLGRKYFALNCDCKCNPKEATESNFAGFVFCSKCEHNFKPRKPKKPESSDRKEGE